MSTTFTFNSIATTQDTLQLIEEQKALIKSLRLVISRLSDECEQHVRARIEERTQLAQYKDALESIVGGMLP